MSRLWTSIQLMLANTYDELFPKPSASLPPKPTTALEDRLREILEELGASEESTNDCSSIEQLEILYHVCQVAQHHEKELRAKYEAPHKVNTEILGRAMFESTNCMLGNTWEKQDESWRAEYMAEAGSAMSVVLVALCRIPKKRLQDLLIQSEGNLQLFLEAAVHEAVDTAQAGPKLDA